MFFDKDSIFQRGNVCDIDWEKELSRLFKPVARTKRYTIKVGRFTNEFEVAFTAEGEAVSVTIKNSTREPDPVEERINFLKTKLSAAVATGDWASVQALSKELESLKPKEQKK